MPGHSGTIRFGGICRCSHIQLGSRLRTVLRGSGGSGSMLYLQYVYRFGIQRIFALAEDYLAPPILIKVDKKTRCSLCSRIDGWYSKPDSLQLRIRCGCSGRRIPAYIGLCNDLHLGIDSKKEDSGGTQEVQDPRRISVPGIRVCLPDYHCICCILYQWYGLLYRWCTGYRFRSYPLLHLEEDVRRIGQEGSCFIPA